MKKFKFRKKSYIFMLWLIVLGSCYKPVVNLHDDPNAQSALIAVKADTADVVGSYDYGSIVVNTTKSMTFTIYNYGNKTLDLTGIPSISLASETYFQISSLPSASIAGNSSVTFTIVFVPGAVAGIERSTTVNILNTSQNQANYSFTISGRASASPEAAILVQADGQTIDVNETYVFVDQKKDTVGNWITFTIHNIGTADLVLSNFSNGLTHFEKIDPAGLTVSAGSFTTFTVRFKPTIENSILESVSFNHNAVNKASPFTIKLSGNGVLPHISVLNGVTQITAYDFGSVKSGLSSSIVTLTIKNNGQADLNLTNSPLVQLVDPDGQFELLSAPNPIVPKNGGTSSFNIVFKPTSTGSKTAELRIYHDAPETNYYPISLNGIGTVADMPKLEILINSTVYANLSTYDFGKKKSGTSTPALTVTLKNSGTGVLNLTGSPLVKLSATTEYQITQPAQNSIPANGGTVTFTIVFSPTSVAANKTATITINNDDSSMNPYVLNLLGEGTLNEVPVIAVSREDSASHLWYDVPQNSFYDYGQKSMCVGVNFKIKNIGTVNVQNLSVASSDLLKFFSTAPSPYDLLTVGQESTFILNYCPPASAGTYTAVITINYKDPANASYNFIYQVKGSK